jgi:hypothetical protein
MNAKKVKEIKNIIGYNKENPILRRAYRRMKKTYNKIPWNERRNFLDNLSKDVIMDAYE